MANMELDIKPKMAAIAHGLEMLSPCAFRVVAKMRCREDYFSFGPFCRMIVKFDATARAARRSMKAALSHALALRNSVFVLRALANLRCDLRPIAGIVR